MKKFFLVMILIIILISIFIKASVNSFLNSVEEYSYNVESENIIFKVLPYKQYYVEGEEVVINYEIRYKGDDKSKVIHYGGSLVQSKIFYASKDEWYVHEEPASYFTLDIGSKQKVYLTYKPIANYNMPSEPYQKYFLPDDIYSVSATCKYYDIDNKGYEINYNNETEERLKLNYSFQVINKIDLIKLSVGNTFSKLVPR